MLYVCQALNVNHCLLQSTTVAVKTLETLNYVRLVLCSSVILINAFNVSFLNSRQYSVAFFSTRLHDAAVMLG